MVLESRNKVPIKIVHMPTRWGQQAMTCTVRSTLLSYRQVQAMMMASQATQDGRSIRWASAPPPEIRIRRPASLWRLVASAAHARAIPATAGNTHSHTRDPVAHNCLIQLHVGPTDEQDPRCSDDAVGGPVAVVGWRQSL